MSITTMWSIRCCWNFLGACKSPPNLCTLDIEQEESNRIHLLQPYMGHNRSPRGQESKVMDELLST